MELNTLGLVLAGLAGSILLLAALALVIYRESQRTLTFDRRLSVPRVKAIAFGVGPEHREQRGGGSVRAFGIVLLKAGSMLAPVGAAERQKLTQMIRQAGFAQRDALSIFLSLKLGFAIVAGIATGFWAGGSEMLGQHGFMAVVVALVGFVIGGIVPEYGLRTLVARRTRRMATALPDALDLMVMCLESGLTFERAITTVASELEPIEPNLAGELRLMEAELRVGSNRRAVLQEFYDRTEVEGLRDLAMTLIQSERYGTPLGQSMKNIAANERVQRAARIEARSERLPVLMTLPMLLFVVPGTMMLVAGPAMLTALDALGSLGG